VKKLSGQKLELASRVEGLTTSGNQLVEHANRNLEAMHDKLVQSEKAYEALQRVF